MEDRLKTFNVFLVYTFIFLISCYLYKTFVYKFFVYRGYILEFNMNKFIISIFFIYLFSYLLPKSFKKPSDILLHFHFLLPLLMMFVVYTMENLSTKYLIMSLLSFLLLFYTVKYLKFKYFVISFRPYNKLIIYLIIFFSVIVFAYIFGELKTYFNLDINKVYDYRYLIANATKGWKGYFIPFFSKIIYIIFIYLIIIESNFRKRNLLILILIFLSILIYGFSSQKSLLFIPLLMLFLYFYYHKLTLKNIFKLYYLFFIFLFLINFFTDKDLGLKLMSLTFRRVFIVPAQLNFDYYIFFSNNNFVYYSDSKFLPFRLFYDYPYDLSIPNLIGKVFFNRPEMSANTCWIGMGYAHAGFIGMLIYAIILGLILKYMDYTGKYLGNKFIIISFVPYIISAFISSDLKTVLLTHGLLMYLLVLSILVAAGLNKEKRE